MVPHPTGALAPVVLLLAGCASTAAPPRAELTVDPLPRTVAVTVDGVPLRPITAAQWGSCRRVASAIGAPVPCPTVLPVPMPGTETAANCAAMSGLICGRPSITASGRYFLVDQYGFEVPDGYVGRFPGGGHFVVMSARHFDARLDAALPPTPIPGNCVLAGGQAPPEIHGLPASMYACGQDPGPSAPLQDQYLGAVGGHELVEWVQDGVTCEVSFHGISSVNRDLALAVARAPAMVRPAGR